MKQFYIFSLVILSLLIHLVVASSNEQIPVEKTKRVQIDSPKIVLQDNQNLVSDEIHRRILADKRGFLDEMYKIIRECVTQKAPGATKTYLNVVYEALKAPFTCSKDKNFRVDLQSSQKGSRDTWAVQINNESALNPRRGSTTVCVMTVQKPTSGEFMYAFNSKKMEGAFDRACNGKKVAVVSKP
jgi:hypothetical protein